MPQGKNLLIESLDARQLKPNRPRILDQRCAAEFNAVKRIAFTFVRVIRFKQAPRLASDLLGTS